LKRADEGRTCPAPKQREGKGQCESREKLTPDKSSLTRIREDLRKEEEPRIRSSKIEKSPNSKELKVDPEQIAGNLGTGGATAEQVANREKEESLAKLSRNSETMLGNGDWTKHQPSSKRI